MQVQRTRYGYAVRIEAGEEIVATLTEFARRENVRAGMLSGLGAVGECELGIFLPASRQYVRRVFRGDFEVGALTGNISELDGAPFTHLHAVIAGEDLVAHTGHLFRGETTVTCEVQVVTDPGVFRRVKHPEL